MSLAVLLPFALTSILLAIAPGPDNIFVLTQSALHGARKGILIVLGLCLGVLLQTLCMMVGITAFISTVPILIILLKLAGVAYLLFLAYKALGYAYHLHQDLLQKKELCQTSQDLTNKSSQTSLNLSAEQLSPYQLVRRGLIMNITNPKVQLFFLSFFPQFIPANLSSWALMGHIAVLGFIFTLATIVVFSAIALLAGSIFHKFKSKRFDLILNTVAGLIFIALSVFTLNSLIS